MFAYCGNSPEIYSDPTGEKKKIWFKLFEDHDPGFIHRAVQVHILMKNNVAATIFESEYVMSGIGRADIVSLSTNEMWEIKYGGSTPDGWAAGIAAAENQLQRYIANGCTLRKGEAFRFLGGFQIDFGVMRCNVNYSTPVEGVILYTIDYTTDMDTEPAFSYAPHTLYKEQKTTVSVMVAIAFCFSGGVQYTSYNRMEANCYD